MNKPSPDFLAGFQHVAKTDVGMRRANNQDSLNVVLAEAETTWRQRGHLFMVADGMGAHAAGELASKLAVDIVPHLYRHHRDDDPPEALQRALAEANAEIHRRGRANQEFQGMGTTASVLVLLPQGALVGHAGDSRVYRLRDSQLEQLTFDHSLVWELRRAGRLAENSDAARSIPKNVITRSLGPNPALQVDLEGFYPLEVGDTFLLCSDGLTGQVSDEELAELLAHLPLDEAARVMVDLANLRGGPDNITLILVRVLDDLWQADSASDSPQPRRRPAGKAGSSTAGLVCLPLAAVCLFVALVLWLTEQVAPAAVFGLAGLAAAGTAGLFWYRERYPAPVGRASGQRLGSGPYTLHRCAAGDDFAGTLSGIVDELRAAARESDWDIRWQDLERYRRRAQAAAADGHFPEAMRHWAAAISFMMEELRRQQQKKSHDSSIEY